jgi:hypothetical protein
LTRVLDKRNKAENIMALEATLIQEKLEKTRKAEEKKKKHKWDGGQRRIRTQYGVIKAREA